jgi:N-acetylmuramoyl-L-alanine amidase CwlA
MIPITKLISKYNFTKANRKKGDYKFIVLHWVGAVSSAKNNAIYFGGGNRNASAGYFVDPLTIIQIVEDFNISWNCGGGLQDQGSSLKKYGAKFHGKATNTNSIGIEMCLDKAGHIADATYKNAAALIKYLQAEYDIDDDHVIRHFDVTGKLCPGTLVKDADWLAWKKKYLGAAATAVKPAPVPAATPAKKTTKPTLKLGSKGSDVKLWQGIVGASKDGKFGAKTVKATKAWQTKKGLTADGVVGPKTWAKAGY